MMPLLAPAGECDAGVQQVAENGGGPSGGPQFLPLQLPRGTLEEPFIGFQDKLAVIEQIRHDLAQENIPAPGVIVVGNQSSGKSSLLEAISGVNLPRAANTCTRRPCVVNLQSDPFLERPYAVVSDKADFTNGKQTHNMEEVGQYIDDLTKRTCADSFSSDPIYVRVVRPRGPTLSLIDLPGITHVVGGDNQLDVHAAVVGMITQYIKNKEMVILVVVPATDDFGNAEALKIAQTHDPEGIRTLGVATKSDCVMPYSDLREKVQCTRPTDIKLTLGWVAVQCRNPKQVEENVPVDTILCEEERLFQTHEALRGLPRQYWGMPTLVDRIVAVQSARVATFIPQCRDLLVGRIAEVKRRLEQLPPVFRDNAQRHLRFIQDAQQLVAFLHAVEETARRVENPRHNITPRVFEMCREFKNKVEKAMPCFTSQDYAKVVEAEAKECAGVSLPNFMPYPVFGRLVRSIIDPLLFEESDALVEQVRDFVQEVLEHFAAEKFREHPLLASSVKELAAEVVDKVAGAGAGYVRAVVQAEVANTYTQDEWYSTLITAFDQAAVDARNKLIREGGPPQPITLAMLAPLREAGVTEAELDKDFFPNFVQCMEDQYKKMMMYMQLCILAYMKVVCKRVCDNIPMHIRTHLVSESIQTFGNQIIVQYTGSDGDKLEHLMEERPDVKAKREELQASLARLTRSLQKLKAM